VSEDRAPRHRHVHIYVHMAQMNVYLPEELAVEARAAGLNVSRLTQNALYQELAQHRTRSWLQRVAWQRATEIPLDAAFCARRAVESDP
jgi:post-segregation antitoxin (ccd killing protein)